MRDGCDAEPVTIRAPRHVNVVRHMRKSKLTNVWSLIRPRQVYDEVWTSR